MKSVNLATATLAVALLTTPALAQSTTPETPPATSPAPPAAQAPAMPAPSKPNPAALLGKDVFSSDQTRLGKVERVVTGADASSHAILIKSGGFLGFGGKMVAIPDSKFSMRGDTVQLQLTADEVSKLPEANEQG